MRFRKGGYVQVYFWPYSTHTLIRGVATQCGITYPGDVVNHLNLNDQIAAVLSLEDVHKVTAIRAEAGVCRPTKTIGMPDGGLF